MKSDENDRAPTLKDVGKQAGVSYQTVSRVMNGSERVSPETRELVMAAAQQLGFRVNRVAGSLRTNRSRTIGLVMSDVANLFFAEVVGGVEAEAALNNYSVILANSNEDLAREREAVIGLMERRVDGLIVAPTEGYHGYLSRDLPEHFPLVAINRKIDEMPCGAVLSDNEGGARIAVQYLLERGHTRIGALSGSGGLMTSRERIAGFKAALKEARVPLRRDWIRYAGLKSDTACECALELLASKDRPTALFATSNTIAEGVLLAMRELRLRRNEDVEVICFDDVPWARLVDPPMPVVAQDTHQIGRLAVRMMLGLIDRSGAASDVVRLPTRLLTNQIVVPRRPAQHRAPAKRARATAKESGAV
ncbi:substrate-binding domain-containing protein [Paraburkholderia sp. CNPSo 3157]|uniref:Substrate-binding domain-containing protein n=1 Tax=Paraburkholderia franconis TaxID=2654983 RepID=A0A7X1THJ5_9BURK|nr:LacI family DNA-binding transcriptional regulator [Paraburkholderia franconis]MPW19632.1 substrate-binding domain-containing protein [Paraburkholderia franconis]